MRQAWTSRTLVFDDDVHARAFFEALLCDNMDLSNPENAGLLFRRGQRSGRPSPPAGRAGSRPRSTGTATWSPSTCSTIFPPGAVPQGRRRAAHRNRG